MSTAFPRGARRWSIIGSGVLQAGEGLGLCLRPEVLSGLGPNQAHTVLRIAARILGLRLLGQGLVLILWPRGRPARVALGVEALHAASMIALAAASPTYRKPAVASAAAALGTIGTLVPGSVADPAR